MAKTVNFYDFEYWPWDKYGIKEDREWNLSQFPKDWAEEKELNKVYSYPYYDAPKFDWYHIEVEAEDQYEAVFAIEKLLDETISIPPYLSGLGNYQITFSEDTNENEYTATWIMREIGDYIPTCSLHHVIYMDKLDYAVNIIAFSPYEAFIQGMKIIEDCIKKEKGNSTNTIDV